MFKKKLFGTNVEPACAYCEYGDLSTDGAKVLCVKKGVVTPAYRCGKYLYAPLKRIPRGPSPLPTFKAEDFEL